MQVILNKYKWIVRGNVHACGYCFDSQGTLYCGEQLCAYFANIADEKEFAQRAHDANGFFAVVIQTPQRVLAATDRICRFPLYYSNQAITDDHAALATSLEWDDLGRAFYRASGATFPGHTLLQSVRQLPPAGIAIYQSSSWSTDTYYSFLCKKKEERAISVDQLDQIMVGVFDRFLKTVNGRQLIIPLTAGNDSRLILCMLKRLHYSNVLCFTIEGKDGQEWEGADMAARQLNYPHVKIDMQDEKVRQLLNPVSECFENYYCFVGGLTNFCWLAEYVAVRYLEQQGLISKDAIFVPGHSGDTIGGSHLTKAKVKEQMAVSALVRRMQYIGFEYGTDQKVKNALQSYFSNAVQKGYTPYSAYQNWIVQHRQAYNIIHSVRTYDFFGYEVRLPLWDTCLCDVFARLPYASLQASSLYIQYVQYVLGLLGLNANPNHKGTSWQKVAIRKWLKKHMPTSMLRLWRKPLDPIGEWALSLPLAREMSSYLGKPFVYTNSNELLVRWYEMRVAQGRG